MPGLILEENAIRLNTAGAGSAGTAVTGTTIDTDGYDGVLVFTTIATANAGNFLKLQCGDVSDGSDKTDTAGSKVVAVANGQVVGIAIDRPIHRYVTPVVIRAGANTATGDLYHVLYKKRQAPASNNVTNTLITKALNSPADGTP